MRQQGIVTSVLDNSNAMVLVKRHSSCENCNACKMGNGEEKTIEIEAINRISASAGQTVTVDMEHQNVLKAAFIIYVIPLVALLVGVILTSRLINTFNVAGNVEMISALVGFIFMAVAFLVIKKKDSKFRTQEEYIPVIVEIAETE